MYTGTCLKLHMNFVIQGYTEIRRDRSVGNGGGLPNLSSKEQGSDQWS